MLYAEASARELLRRIVRRLSGNDSLAEDLMQDGLVQLWLLEKRYPGQTRSWYLQGCLFHLRNKLSGGRSLDAPKRSKLRLSQLAVAEEESLLRRWEIETAILPESGLKESVRLLTERLDAVGQKVLKDLLAGCGPTEIARKLHISHQAVTKRRKQIASVARKLGIATIPSNWNGQPRLRSAKPAKTRSSLIKLS